MHKKVHYMTDLTTKTTTRDIVFVFFVLCTFATMIVYEQLSYDGLHETTEFLLKHFFPNEPMALHIGLPNSQVERWLPTLLKQILRQSASVVALDSTRKMVGVSINFLMGSSIPELLEIVDPTTEPIMFQIATFLNRMEGDVEKIWCKDNGHKGFFTLFLAVDSKIAGQGIGTRLAKASEARARELGNVDCLRVDVTSEFSYKLYHAIGYEVIFEEAFSDSKELKLLPQRKDMLNVHKYARHLIKIV